MKKVSFTRVTSGPMATHGFHRYTVWLDQIFIGEVFQYRFSPSSSLRWMAQRPDGMLHYGAGCLNSRKEAAAMLVG